MKLKNITINGYKPEQYAVLWGDGRTDEGCMFYNFSIAHVPKTAEWLEQFLVAIARLMAVVRTNPQQYDEESYDELHQLNAYVATLLEKELHSGTRNTTVSDLENHKGGYNGTLFRRFKIIRPNWFRCRYDFRNNNDLYGDSILSFCSYLLLAKGVKRVTL